MGKKALVVDDSPTIRQVQKLLLDREAHELLARELEVGKPEPEHGGSVPHPRRIDDAQVPVEPLQGEPCRQVDGLPVLLRDVVENQGSHPCLCTPPQLAPRVVLQVRRVQLPLESVAEQLVLAKNGLEILGSGLCNRFNCKVFYQYTKYVWCNKSRQGGSKTNIFYAQTEEGE